MYVSKIPLNDVSNINLNGIQASEIIRNASRIGEIDNAPATPLVEKARAGRLSALKHSTNSVLDMRIEKVVHLGARKRQGFEDIDAIAKLLIMHGNDIAAE